MTDFKTYDREQVYREIYDRFMRKEVPPCAQCGSHSTASVQVGMTFSPFLDPSGMLGF